MAHFAQLDENNIVTFVAVVDNAVLNVNGTEDESLGVTYLQNIVGANTRWVQTSYNRSFRKNYAGIGYKYDSNLDAFIPPKPYPSWIFIENNCLWEPPVSYPNDGQNYFWNENILNWTLLNNL